VVWMRSWGVRGRDGLSSMVGRSREGKVRSLRWWRREGRKRDELGPPPPKELSFVFFYSFPSTPSPSLFTVHPIFGIVILWICFSTSCMSLPQSPPATASTAPFSSSLPILLLPLNPSPPLDLNLDFNFLPLTHCSFMRSPPSSPHRLTSCHPNLVDLKIF